MTERSAVVVGMEGYRPLKTVEGKILGHVCIECGRLSTAEHLEDCTSWVGAAGEDSERLDWIFANWYRHNETMRLPLPEQFQDEEPKTWREQIDAAREAIAKGKP